MIVQDRLIAVKNQIGYLLKIYSRKRQFDYVVRPSLPIEGRSIQELRELKFWVGSAEAGYNFNLDETIVIFRAVFDIVAHVESIRHTPAASTEPLQEPMIDLEPPDEVIQRTLKEIVFSPPA
jgi:hypothetical protein